MDNLVGNTAANHERFHLGPRTRGFTLVELLVVITIIAVLAFLSIVVSRKVYQGVDRARTAADLKSLSVALNICASDQEGMLPGPLYTGVTPVFSANDKNTFVYSVAPYVGYTLNKNPNQPLLVKELYPLAWKRALGTYDMTSNPQSITVYSVNESDWPAGTMPSRPFGYPGSFSYSRNPLRLAQIDPVSRVWMLRENMLKKPTLTTVTYPHGNSRAFLFFDGHMEYKPVDFVAFPK